MRTAIPLMLIAFQLGAIAYARFVPTRYFCWAPFDIQTDYVATSIVNGRELTSAEFRQRYRGNKRGFDNRSPQHVIDMLQQVEEKRARLGDKATLTMTFRVNGKPPRSGVGHRPHRSPEGQRQENPWMAAAPNPVAPVNPGLLRVGHLGIRSSVAGPAFR